MKSVHEEISPLLDEVTKAVRQFTPDPEFSARVLLNIENAATQSDWDYTSLIKTILVYLKAAEGWQTALEGLLGQVEELKTRRQKQFRFSPEWWQGRLSELGRAFQTDPEKGVNAWQQTYVELALMNELELCQALVEVEFPFPLWFIVTLPIFQEGTAALLNGRYEQALDLLDYLAPLDESSEDSPLDPLSRSLLHFLRGRIYLHHRKDPQAASIAFEHSARLSPKDGRPDAGMGEMFLAQDDMENAETSFQQAISKSPDQPEGYLGMGKIYETKKLWDVSDAWYSRAVESVQFERNSLRVLSRLLARLSGNAYLSAARFLKASRLEEALQAVDKALGMELVGDGDSVSIANQLKGEILEILDRHGEAAEAFYKAAQGYYWLSQFQLASELYERVYRNNPDHIPSYRSWADSLYILSYIPEPPYRDEQLNQKAWDIWKKGMQKRLPEEDDSWTYITGAFIVGQTVRLTTDKKRRWDLYWQAVTYLESSILWKMDKNDTLNKSIRLGYMGRFMSALEMHHTALDAIDYAMKLRPDDAQVLESASIVYANAGEWIKGERVIKKALKNEESSFYQYVLSWIRLHQRRFKKALELIEPYAKENPEVLDSHEIQAISYRGLEQIPEAKREYSWIWKRQDDPRYIGSEETFASAAYSLSTLGRKLNSRLLDEAIRRYDALRDDPVRGINSRKTLGLCYLVRADSQAGDLEKAKSLLQETIRQATIRLHLQDLKDDIELAHPWFKQPDTLEIVEELKDLIGKRIKPLKRMDAKKELMRAIANPLTTPDTWAWVGARASLARWHAEREQWTEAASLYQELLDDPRQRVIEARQGLDRAISKLTEMATARLKDGDSPRALDLFKKILLLSPFQQDSLRQADLESHIGYSHYILSTPKNLQQARRHFTQALRLYLQSGNSGEGMGQVVRSLSMDPQTYWVIVEEWQSMKEGLSLDLVQAMDAAMRALTYFLDDYYKLLRLDTSSSNYIPVATPIIVYLGPALAPEWADEKYPFINDLLKVYIPQMRDSLLQKTGINVPGVRLRRDTSLPENSYIISLFEVPVVMGFVEIDKVYVPASQEPLVEVGFPWDSLVEATDPLNGKTGLWLPAARQADIDGHDMEIWSPGQFLINHLKSVLLGNLSDFIGIDDSQRILNDWKKDTQLATKVETVLSATYGVQLTRLFKELVREQVPVNRPEELLDGIQAASLSEDFSQVVRQVRLHLKERLPGNQPRAEHDFIPPELEVSMLRWLSNDRGKLFLAAPPEEVQDWLAEIRPLVGEITENEALVVQDPLLRPALRRLVEQEFPSVVVLAREELLEGGV